MKKYRYYLHGDEYEKDPTLFYCGICDVFHSPEDFSTATHMARNWAKFKSTVFLLFDSESSTRPNDTKNILGSLMPEGKAEIQRLLIRKTVRVTLPPKLRFCVFQRDGYACQICGATAKEGAKLEVDHRIPLAKGGTNDKSNLWTLCFTCNIGKSDSNL